MIEQVTELDEFTFICGHHNKVVVDIYSPHCMPCKVLLPALEELSVQAPHLKFIKIDISNFNTKDQTSDIDFKFETVTAVPTIVLIEKKKVVDVITGAPSPKSLREKLTF